MDDRTRMLVAESKAMKEKKQTENLNTKIKVVIQKLGALLLIFDFHNSIFLFEVCKIKPFHSVNDVRVFDISSQLTYFSFKIEKAEFETPYLIDKILEWYYFYLKSYFFILVQHPPLFSLTKNFP